ncbi:hypothetical protein [Sulfuricurvum sp.]|uniref:hypothetical protein n=1 Tax=Sulfuricurvum sp. TaxID=2025608 RepID=UPI002E2FC631|nr:hypothetical protein [Sulfuricurvum sp.]HEX5330623.1 hypothetical protein [Sulfuricurvum sp.]
MKTNNPETLLCSSPHRHDIYKAICTVLNNSLTPPTSSEPVIVAKIVHELPLALNSLRLPIKTASMYVHQRPYVTYNEIEKQDPTNPKKKVEIGDLLLIRTLKKSNGSIIRSALLLQAKKSVDEHSALKVGSSNNTQHNLYAYWPEFIYVSNPLQGIKRKIVGPHLANGSKYLIFTTKCIPHHYHHYFYDDLHFCCDYPECCLSAIAIPDGLTRLQYFATELFDFITGNAGREFVLHPGKGNVGWDQVITDLIETTKNWKSTATMKSAGMTSSTRLSGALFFTSGEFDSSGSLHMSNTGTDSNGGNDPIFDSLQDTPDEGGIPIIEFVIDEVKD